LFGISGFWSIKRGSEFLGISGKFSVIGGFGGSLLSNHFLPVKMESTLLSGS